MAGLGNRWLMVVEVGGAKEGHPTQWLWDCFSNDMEIPVTWKDRSDA